ncbi:IS1595 family transposase [Methylotenera sp.]|uniref:IS1595 family transposase n=1 Tax=Methylotenera sp. TaxID=2051956 RepID=UPI002732993A|nr:IS1595 family transposase [Methylotenera sp.]MDP3210611.1 IS1595 family transposase [Methylotenera sp.]
MAQHFLLSPDSRGIKSPIDITRMSDQEAFDLLCELRWGKDGTQCCPQCGVIRKHHYIKSRKQFRCAEVSCTRTFSVTSGTKFAYHKKSLRDILAATCLYVSHVCGTAALRTASFMGAAYKPMLVYHHKIKEALYETRDLSPMSGEVEIDGAYFHYYVRPANYKANRVDRRLARNLNPNKRCVLVIRERGLAGTGAKRSITTVIKVENEKDALALAKKYIVPKATIYTDNHNSYGILAAEYDLKKINHDEAYSHDGVNENQAESFFNRLRKLKSNIHKCDPRFLNVYANEIVWREDNRRVSFYDQFTDILKKCLQTGQSRLWSKYWQGNRVTEDCLFSASECP